VGIYFTDIGNAAAAAKTIPEGVGLHNPPSGMVYKAAGATQPQKSTMAGRPKNHVFETHL
jgi:hypothetical protein